MKVKRSRNEPEPFLESVQLYHRRQVNLLSEFQYKYKTTYIPDIVDAKYKPLTAFTKAVRDFVWMYGEPSLAKKYPDLYEGLISVEFNFAR